MPEPEPPLAERPEALDTAEYMAAVQHAECDGCRGAFSPDDHTQPMRDWHDKPRRLVYRLCAEVDRLRALLDDPPSVTCPRCARTSHNPNDVAAGYCGHCRDWTSPPASPDGLSPEDAAAVDAAVRSMAVDMWGSTGGPCPAHHPTARLVADLPLADQLEAIASCVPCDQPTALVQPGSPIAGLMKQCATAIRTLVGQRDRAVSLLGNLHAFDSVPNDHSYVGSPIAAAVGQLLTEVRSTDHFVTPCTCVPGRCDEGNCTIAAEVTAALMEVGGWPEIDGDGTPATVLAGYVRALPGRLTDVEE